MIMLPRKKLTYKKYIARVAEHLVTFHKLLFDVIGFQHPMIKPVCRDGLDSAQNTMQVSVHIVSGNSNPK